MNDGTTATPTISPVPSEEDMNKVRSIFEQGLNSIIGIAQISKDVEALRTELASLKNDLDYVRHRNRELDQALADVRSQRDQAMRERDEARTQLAETNNSLNAVDAHNSSLQGTINNLQAELEAVRKDRDQAYDAWHKAEQAKEQAEAKLHDIKSVAMDMFGLKAPEPTPVPTPNVVNVPIEDSNRHAEAWVYDTDPGFNWSHPYEWDHITGKHRQRAA